MKKSACSAMQEQRPNAKLHATQVYEEYGKFIYAVFKQNYSNRRDHDVEDLFHDFFISLIENPIPTEVRDIKSYLHRSIKNDIKDAIIKRINYQKRCQIHSLANKDRFATPSPSHYIEIHETLNRTFEHLNTIPQCEATAVVERHYRGNNISESAKIMNIKKRSFSSYLSCGLKRLRSLLCEE